MSSVTCPATQEDLEFRRAFLGAASVEHLCKSIIMVNTRAPAAITDCSNALHSKYYLVIVQVITGIILSMISKCPCALCDGGKPPD